VGISDRERDRTVDVLCPNHHATRRASKYCKFEFESFLARESVLRRNDLIFPIHYIEVPASLDEAEWRGDPVLEAVAKRQYVDWRDYRRKSVDAPDFGQAIEVFCRKIAKKLREPWLSAEERLQLDVEVNRRVMEEERVRQEAEAKRRPEEQDALTKHRAPLTAGQERALKPGDSFKEGDNYPEMIVVPAGRFLMGSPAGQGEDDEHPQHEVTIAKPFAVAKALLTAEEWDACAAHGACVPNYQRRGIIDVDRVAVNFVSWDDAKAYVKWLSGVTGKSYRLLSEAEHEYATRNGLLPNHVIHRGTWTEDCLNPNYQGAPADGRP
jgi:hypothetical protein